LWYSPCIVYEKEHLGKYPGEQEQKMDTSKKHRIDEWVEHALYTLLEQTMTKGQITTTDAVALTPLIQMYQAIQLESVTSELDSLWRLFEGGDVGIYIRSIHGDMDVNVKEMPYDGPPQPKKR
jgi:hypothetical protein